MIIHHLGEEPSVLNRFIAQLRDVNIQADRMRFRKNLERIGEVLCYEMSKFLHYKRKQLLHLWAKRRYNFRKMR